MSYEAVMSAVASALDRAGRNDSELTVVAVSKSQPEDLILDVYGAGHRDFGENRAQELVEKAAVLPGDIRWHFVGALQTNKVRAVRPVTTLLHSMDRESLATAWVKGAGSPPPVLIQVNVGDEPQKTGVAMTDVPALADRCAELGIDVRGLMAIPPIPETPEDSRRWFQRLRQLGDELRTYHPGASELSMGMTDDFEVAIEEGATIIRVGRAIFGPRQ
jgi:PLP dependent protein